MARSISKTTSESSSASKTLGKTTFGDKSLAGEVAFLFYNIEYSDTTEEVEDT